MNSDSTYAPMRGKKMFIIKYKNILLVICILGWLVCFPSTTIYAFNSCKDDKSIPLKATLYCDSGFYWLDLGKPGKANEFFKQALELYPNYEVVQQKIKEVSSIIEKNKTTRRTETYQYQYPAAGAQRGPQVPRTKRQQTLKEGSGPVTMRDRIQGEISK